MVFVLVVSLLPAQLVGQRQALALVCAGAASSAEGADKSPKEPELLGSRPGWMGL